MTIFACAPKPSASALAGPTVSVTSPKSGALVDGTSLAQGTASRGSFPISRVIVGIDGTDGTPATGTAQWSALLRTAGYSDGYHTLTVRAVDTAGNVGYASLPVLFSGSQSSAWATRPSTSGTAPQTVTTMDAATTTTTNPVPVFGVQYHGMWPGYGTAEQTQVLDQLVAAGAKWIRMDIGWRWLEEAGPGQFASYYVNQMDTLVNAARARGLKVLVTIMQTPAWANGNKAGNVPPTNVANFYRTSFFLAKHFGDRVNAWEVWNEPNYSGFWVGTALVYVSLLKQGYQGFKAGNPNATVVLGGASHNDVNWLKSMYEAGGRGSFDVMSTHPYMEPTDLPPETNNGTSTTIGYVRNVRALMAQYGDGQKPIWFTEFGWSTHVNGPSEPAWTRGVSPQTQADYLVRTLKYLRANFPYVTNVFWYCERDLDTSGSYLGSFGLLNRDLSPKPSYFAVQSYLSANP